MTVTLIAFAAIAVLLVFYIITSEQRKKKLPVIKKAAPQEHKSRKAEPAPSLGKALEADLMPASKKEAAISPFRADEEALMQEAIPGLNADLRHFLHAGMQSIFTDPTASAGDYPHASPLMRKDIQPDLLHIVLEKIAGLKNFRAQHIRLQNILGDPAIQMNDLSKIILSDPIMTAQILRMANSSYFGMQQKIDSISHALMILGLQNIKNLMYREGMRQLFQAGSAQKREAVAALWQHSAITSVCASSLHNLFEGLNMGALFTLGIIHDIGKLIILELPQAQDLGSSFWDKFPSDVSILEEDQLFGINHAVIGGLVLENWSLSELMGSAVKMHHAPSYLAAEKIGMDNEKLKYVLVLFIADQMAKLFIDWNEGITRTYSLLESYHSLIDKNKLSSKILDANLLLQIREIESEAVSEQSNKSAMSKEKPERRLRLHKAAAPTGGQGTSLEDDGTIVIKTADSMRKIGRYQIIRELGRGAMGIVYLGMDPLINREVAIKTLRSQDADEKEIAATKTRFFREAKAIGKLSHPNIVTIYDVGDYQGTAYIAMEFLDGADLVPYCDKKNLLPLAEIIRIISSTALALDYAHKNGIVHRDIKPGNIRILKNGAVKVIDFGIARVIETSSTNSGIIIGSPNYMSPEQVDGQALDGRSDLFSLGAIFYELLTGEKPFKGDSLTSLLLQIKTAPPAPIGTLSPQVPAACIAIVEKALAKDKEQRYLYGQELAADLQAMMKNTAPESPSCEQLK